MDIYGILLSKHFNYFRSSRMHISLPAVNSTGDATYGADDNQDMKNNKLSVTPLLLLSSSNVEKSFRKRRGRIHT
jgi:hypothetical protein